MRIGFLFLDIFTKLQKATISFAMSVCPSVRPSVSPHGKATGRIFKKFNFSIFLQSVEKSKVSLKSVKNNGYFT